MNEIARFVNAGLTDAETRIVRRLPPATIDDPWVTRVVASGVLARGLSWVIRTGRRAVATSRVAAIVGGATASWQNTGWAARRWAAGLFLLAAVITHVSLTVAAQDPAGWLWLVLPGIAAMVAVVLIVASAAPVRSR